jgi:hypothetical protein
MTKLSLITAAILAASITPALADGKQATLASVNMVIANTECGLDLPNWSPAAAAESLEFTGVSAEQWANSVGDMASIRAAEMYANKSIVRFCVRMAQIYAGAK